VYLKSHEDMVTSVEEITGAVQQVKRMMASTPSLVQEKAAEKLRTLASKPHLPARARRVLAAFLSTSETSSLYGIDVKAPEAASFESQSGGVVDMMVDLQDKLREQTASSETEEMNAQHACDMMMQSLTDQIEGHHALRGRKASTKKGKEQDSASAKGDLVETTTAKEADEKYLRDLRDTCHKKSVDFEARQQLRGSELKAIGQAIEILSSDSVSGAADKHLPSFPQFGHFFDKKPSLAQLRSGESHSPTQAAARAYLEMESRRCNSRMLAALSVKVSENPFAKVKKMIKDMVIKLTEEATDEAEHKGWCDTELATNQQTRESKSSEIEELNASIEEMTAESQKLANDVAKLSSELTDLDAAVAKATELRQQEKQRNASTLKDATGAIAAIQKATDVLKEFYAKAAGATAFVQKSKGVGDDMPETFDKPYTGMGGEGGILGMLEVILSDFQRIEAETSENEAAAAREFDSFMEDSSMDKAVKDQEVTNKNTRITKLGSDANEAKNDLASSKEELNAAMAYYSKLKPSCIDSGISYDERVAARKEEIASLQEALKILAGEEIA